MLLIDLLYKENVQTQNKIVVRLGFITVCVSAPPRILDQNKTIDSFVGETVMLRCQVTGIDQNACSSLCSHRGMENKLIKEVFYF